MTESDFNVQIEALEKLINQRFSHLEQKIDGYQAELKDFRKDYGEQYKEQDIRLRALEDWKLEVKTTVRVYALVATLAGAILSWILKGIF